MRLATFGLAVLGLAAVLAPAPVRAEMPYDPYPWCAVYGGDAGGSTNCGFLTLDQCRATVNGMGGYCAHNQFYNPGRTDARSRYRVQH